ncbi:MAG: potassium channel family protein [Nevskia sp.]|nr:potassium channel family protein [Nevskia sp.]
MIVVAGSGPLAGAIERNLQRRQVDARRETLLRDDDDERLESLLGGASVLVLAAGDDSSNVDLALRAKRLRRDLPLVVRLFDGALASYLTETLQDVRILSMSGVAAPAFAEAADRLLAAGGKQSASAGGRADSWRARRFHVDPVLGYALLCLFLLVFPSALFFSRVLGLRYMDGLYFVWTTVMTVGYGDISLKEASDGVKLYGMGLMLAGAGFIAILFAILSDWVMGRRLDMLHGRTAERGAGHVVIAGGGNIGLRIARLLAGGGRRLVLIERDAQSSNAAALRDAGHHIVIADATRPETLQLASLHTAALVIAVTDADAVNLQVVLHARRCGVPAIMRADSPELSQHVNTRGDAIALSPVDAAAERFAAAALELRTPRRQDRQPAPQSGTR